MIKFVEQSCGGCCMYVELMGTDQEYESFI